MGVLKQAERRDQCWLLMRTCGKQLVNSIKASESQLSWNKNFILCTVLYILYYGSKGNGSIRYMSVFVMAIRYWIASLIGTVQVPICINYPYSCSFMGTMQSPTNTLCWGVSTLEHLLVHFFVVVLSVYRFSSIMKWPGLWTDHNFYYRDCTFLKMIL